MHQLILQCKNNHPLYEPYSLYYYVCSELEAPALIKKYLNGAEYYYLYAEFPLTDSEQGIDKSPPFKSKPQPKAIRFINRKETVAS